MQQLRRLMANPTFRRLVAWATPLIIGWVMKKIDDSAQKRQSSTKSKKK